MMPAMVSTCLLYTSIDGDYILAICGSDLAARGKLANSEIVSTVMCNLGFSIAMKEQGFEMVDVYKRQLLAAWRR